HAAAGVLLHAPVLRNHDAASGGEPQRPRAAAVLAAPGFLRVGKPARPVYLRTVCCSPVRRGQSSPTVGHCAAYLSGLPDEAIPACRHTPDGSGLLGSRDLPRSLYVPSL